MVWLHYKRKQTDRFSVDTIYSNRAYLFFIYDYNSFFVCNNLNAFSEIKTYLFTFSNPNTQEKKSAKNWWLFIILELQRDIIANNQQYNKRFNYAVSTFFLSCLKDHIIKEHCFPKTYFFCRKIIKNLKWSLWSWIQDALQDPTI